jgi:hypothetical protein
VRRFAFVLVLACASASTKSAGAQSVGPMAGATERALVLPGDTVQLCFSMRAADTAFAKPLASGSSSQCSRLVVKACGTIHVFVRSFRNGVSDTLTADAILFATLDTMATTGPCSPAAPPGQCDYIALNSAPAPPDPIDWPDSCALIRNRFLGGVKMQAVLDSFVARTYAPKSPP